MKVYINGDKVKVIDDSFYDTLTAIKGLLQYIQDSHKLKINHIKVAREPTCRGNNVSALLIEANGEYGPVRLTSRKDGDEKG